ncbi:MAG: YciI family protein [Aquabacterium sp.]
MTTLALLAPVWVLAQTATTSTTPPPPAAPAASAAAPASLLFAVEIRTGPAWDASKPPQDQAHFRAHSQHLRHLREQGVLVMGARYADKGLLVLRAASLAQAQALLKDDPSMQAGVFSHEVHEFRVFYSGAVAVPARP